MLVLLQAFFVPHGTLSNKFHMEDKETKKNRLISSEAESCGG